VKMGPIRCPETSVNNYHTTPCNTREDRRFREIGFKGMEWINLAQDRDQRWDLVIMIMNLRVP
jgi:hypothetical protein